MTEPVVTETVETAPAGPVIPPGAQIAPEIPDWAKDPKKAIDYVAKLTSEAASHRIAKKDLEATTAAAIEQAKTAAAETAAAAAAEAERQRIGKALGFIKEDDNQPITPENLAQQFAAKEAEYQARIRALTLETALKDALVNTHPGAHHALKGSGVLDGLDPSAADFTDQLKVRVDRYLTENPYFKIDSAPARAAGVPGMDVAGGTGTSTDLDSQIAEAMKAGDVSRSIALKRAKAFQTS